MTYDWRLEFLLNDRWLTSYLSWEVVHLPLADAIRRLLAEVAERRMNRPDDRPAIYRFTNMVDGEQTTICL